MRAVIIQIWLKIQKYGNNALVMQKINTAYQQRDLDALQQISSNPSIVDPINDSLEISWSGLYEEKQRLVFCSSRN